MRQRIFASNFVIFWGANAYFGCESVMRQNCDLFFSIAKGAFSVYFFTNTGRLVSLKSGQNVKP